MIKNERQYRITRAQVERFEQALARLEQARPEESQVHPKLKKAQEDALCSQLDDLRAEVDEYERLKAGNRAVLEVASFDQLPRALIQARIASGLSQKELAARLGLREQQIQRYEATEYASASLSRVANVIRALGIEVREELVLPGRR
jgi:ribosome-binding protein aMBF1 (putative translation factor)